MSERGTYLADLFGGHGGVARAAEQRDITGRVWDLAAGPRYDLCRRSVRRQLCREARRGLLIAACLAPPCSTFSLQQRGALRALDQPWGKSGLDDRLQSKVDSGNRTARAALSLARQFLSLGVSWVLEHPAGSYLWKTPEMQALIDSPHVMLITIDQCAFRVPWRKSTRLLFGNCDPEDVLGLASHRCKSTSKICSFTGKPHTVLQGSLTAPSQRYPPLLCRRLADVLLGQAIHRRSITRRN